MPTFIPFLSRRVFDFSTNDNVTTEVVVVRALAVVGWRVGELVVRVHAINIAGAGLLSVIALMTEPSVDAPETDFVLATPKVATAKLSTVGELVHPALNSPFGGHLRLIVQAIAQVGGGALTATVSAGLYLRERP